MLLQVDDDDDCKEEETRPEPPLVPNSDQSQEHHLSLNAMKGSSGLGTIRFQGRIHNTNVQILVDGASSDNFLQPRIAQFLNLSIEPAPTFKVLVGNGQSMTADGFIRELPLLVQGHELHVPVYLLPVAGADLVLGTAWFATLGPHVHDYAGLSIKFYNGEKFITLRGENNNKPTAA